MHHILRSLLANAGLEMRWGVHSCRFCHFNFQYISHNPMAEHYRFNDDCFFVSQMTEIRYQPMPFRDIESLVDSYAQPEPENSAYSNRTDCCVFLDAERQELLLPCQHIVTCSACLGQTTPNENEQRLCPKCRAQIEGQLKIFF